MYDFFYRVHAFGFLNFKTFKNPELKKCNSKMHYKKAPLQSVHSEEVKNKYLQTAYNCKGRKRN
jgi:hypothetical protein